MNLNLDFEVLFNNLNSEIDLGEKFNLSEEFFRKYFELIKNNGFLLSEEDLLEGRRITEVIAFLNSWIEMFKEILSEMDEQETTSVIISKVSNLVNNLSKNVHDFSDFSSGIGDLKTEVIAGWKAFVCKMETLTPKKLSNERKKFLFIKDNLNKYIKNFTPGFFEKMKYRIKGISTFAEDVEKKYQEIYNSVKDTKMVSKDIFDNTILEPMKKINDLLEVAKRLSSDVKNNLQDQIKGTKKSTEYPCLPKTPCDTQLDI
jgi:hypothetical protein